jgi:hypothetical protein
VSVAAPARTVALDALPAPSAVDTSSGVASGPKVVSGAPSAAAATSRALGLEAMRIDAARRALGNGDFRRALGELDGYERSKRIGVLDREAELLRIRALVLSGDAARATALAQAYLATHPRDAYAAELERVLAAHGTRVSPAEGIDR